MNRGLLALVLAGLLACVVALVWWWVKYIEKSVMG